MNCEMEVQYGNYNDHNSGPCGSHDAVRECADCGKKLCRKHLHQCCDRVWCEFCLELHQSDGDGMAGHPIPKTVNIRTEHVFPPIPIRSCDWVAYDENTYDGAPDAGPQIVGYGSTEHEAIADFREQLLESL